MKEELRLFDLMTVQDAIPAIEPYWSNLFRFTSDDEAKVRLSFIWASENIAANTPDIYRNHMSVFEKLL